MSVRTRIEDARLLASAGRMEGAFVQVLIAAAATSRKRYAQSEWNDGEAFKNFIYDELGVITGCAKYNVEIPFQGKRVPLEDILYHHLRCQLFHEGEMPDTIVFQEPVVKHGKKVTAMHLGTPLGFPTGWIERLVEAVWLAPENDDLWHDDQNRRQLSIVNHGNLCHDGLYCRRPGRRTKQEKSKDERLSWSTGAVPYRVSYPPGVAQIQIADALETQAKELRTRNNSTSSTSHSPVRNS